MSSPRIRRLTSIAAVAAMSATGMALVGGTSSAAPQGPTLDIQLLSFNDFHGNLEPPSGSSGRIVTGHHLGTDSKGNPVAIDDTVDAGGVAYLATHLKELRKGHPNTLTVAAGDIIGASPLLSAAFHDEPTVEAMNTLGLDATAVGNHEFDEGYKELQRMAAGGCIDDGDGANNQNSCPDHEFQGAEFPFLAANVKYAGTNRTILPPYTVKNVGGAKIAFIGMTLKETPNIVTKSGVQGLEFTDEAQTANALVPALKKQGVNAIVVLIHQGAVPSKETWNGPDGKTYTVNPRYDWSCESGPLAPADSPVVDIASRFDPAIDMVISGHTHQPYVCNVPDPAGQQRLVTSASSFGRLITETTLKYDRRTKDIVRPSVGSQNRVVTRDVTPDAQESALVSHYQALVAPIANRPLGTITSDAVKAANSAGESPLGDLIADAQLADPSVVTGGQTPVIAFMNPGGIRADLTYASSTKGEGDGVVTYEEAFTVQPFNNYLVSMTMTGAQIKELLREQWGGGSAFSPNTVTSPKILQVSKGFSYSYSDASGTRVLGDVLLGGVPLEDGTAYRVVTNNFLSDGGDGFPAFIGATEKYFGGLDIDAFANHLEANSPYTPGALTRITRS